MDKETHEKLDKERFRRDNVEDAMKKYSVVSVSSKYNTKGITTRHDLNITAGMSYRGVRRLECMIS